jgi:hypothetical protein
MTIVMRAMAPTHEIGYSRVVSQQCAELAERGGAWG